MGRRGPPPKPTVVKKRQGTYRKDRDPELASVSMPAGAPPMPDDLPDAGRRRWMETVPRLLEAGTLSLVDGGALEAYCRSFARWQALESDAEKKPVVKTPFGPKINPACGEARKLHKEVIQPLELALGLHYAARSRVKAPGEPKKKDPVKGFLFGNGLRVVPGGRTKAAAGTTARQEGEGSASDAAAPDAE